MYGDLADRPGYHFLRYYLAGVLQDVCGWGHMATLDAADPYALFTYLKTVLAL